MAAPTPTTRVSPTGIKLGDGHSTLITMSLDTNIEIWERSVTPPGIDGGDEIDVTTMHNTVWRQTHPRQLKTLTEFSFSGMYDPIVYTSILAMINRKQTFTVRFPDGTTLAFYGFLKSFQPSELVEGSTPEATFTVVPTNADPTSGAEEAPVLASVAGT
jgi:hypothetical protein